MTSWIKMIRRAVVPLLMATSQTRAGTLEVAPVSIELPAGVVSTVVTVTNHNPVRTSIQVRGYAWSQSATADQLTRADDLIISPPIFELEPDESQTVRLMVRQPASSREATFRLLVDELPSGHPSGIQFALRLSLPVFVEPDTQIAPARLSWRLVPAGHGMAELSVRNDGARHERLINLVLQVPGVGAVRPTGLPNPYVLAGAERSWQVPVGVASLGRVRDMRLTGDSIGGRIDVPVAVGSP